MKKDNKQKKKNSSPVWRKTRRKIRQGLLRK
jgi:hypothetical protein